MSAPEPPRPEPRQPARGEFWAVLLAFVQVMGPSLLLLLSGFFIVYGVLWLWLNWWPLLFG